MDYMLIYPATPDPAAAPLKLFMAANVHLYKDAPVVSDGLKHPLVMFSHGAAATAPSMPGLANTSPPAAILSRWSIIIGPTPMIRAHCMCATESGSGRAISAWTSPTCLPTRSGGHISTRAGSAWQGTHRADLRHSGSAAPRSTRTCLLEYQRGWKNNQIVPAYLREQMGLDAKPAQELRDDRVRAAFAMAPGDIQAFGMDEAGLRRMAIPGLPHRRRRRHHDAGCRQCRFAARYIPRAQLDVLPGPVSHEIFDNECDRIGRDNYPEACQDARRGSGQAARLHRWCRIEVLRYRSGRATEPAGSTLH